MFCPISGLFAEAGAGAKAEAGVGAVVVQSMALDENQEHMTEIEADLVYRLNYVKILLLGDAGEAIIVNFFTRVLRVTRMVGKDTRKLWFQNIPYPMILGSTLWKVADLLIVVLIFLKATVGGAHPAGMPIMMLLMCLVRGP